MAKFLIFCVPNANSDKGLNVPKMGAESLAQNTPNAQFVCASQKDLDFNKKGFIGRP